MPPTLPADSRTLVVDLSGVTAAHVRRWALELTSGLLVGIGSRSEIWALRRELAGLENMMLVEGARDGIPWRDAYFDCILDAVDTEPSAEMRRVLRPGGCIYSVQV